ncbi:helix-turn-helix transcriptional regulator [Kitasatospora sp. NPDC059599]|uniref:helix-turn-helix transcriptional regulator n=1 Tax=Kitasatospora sp. NPDC059599 TaxID=3346880 RepID=UPI0036B0C530
MEYEFTFIVAGVDVDDESATEALRDHVNAMLLRAGGLDLMTVLAEGENAVQAALDCVSTAKATVPQLRVLRLDRDLVGISEIADRTERSRQNVAQWISGERKSNGTPFPAAEGTAGRSNVWLWTEVNEWLRQYDLADEAQHPTRAEMTEIDFALTNLAPLTPRWPEEVGHAVPVCTESLHTVDMGSDLMLLEMRIQATSDPTRSLRFEGSAHVVSKPTARPVPSEFKPLRPLVRK